jgi:hypothetical protein
MFKLRKAQGLSMNVIIVAVLALLVLVILSVIFTSKMRDTRKSIDSCATANGECVPNDPDYYNDPELTTYCKDKYDKLTSQYDCGSPDEICCIKG